MSYYRSRKCLQNICLLVCVIIPFSARNLGCPICLVSHLATGKTVSRPQEMLNHFSHALAVAAPCISMRWTGIDATPRDLLPSGSKCVFKCSIINTAPIREWPSQARRPAPGECMKHIKIYRTTTARYKDDAYAELWYAMLMVHFLRGLITFAIIVWGEQRSIQGIAAGEIECRRVGFFPYLSIIGKSKCS